MTEQEQMPQFYWNKEKRKICDPADNPLAVKDVVILLNNMYAQLTVCSYAWRILNDGVAVLDTVFFGDGDIEPVHQEGGAEDGATDGPTDSEEPGSTGRPADTSV